jgi:hypothetical protein
MVFSLDTVKCTLTDMHLPADLKTMALVEKYTEFFSLLCLQDASFINLNPYLVACSIISAARRQCGVTPIWSNELVQLGGLSYNHFFYIEEIVFKSFQSTFKPLNNPITYSPESAALSTAESPNLSPAIELFKPQ